MKVKEDIRQLEWRSQGLHVVTFKVGAPDLVDFDTRDAHRLARLEPGPR
jgi:hypothetical protein